MADKVKLIRAKTPVEPSGAYVVAYTDGSCGAMDQLGGWGYVIHDGLDMHENWGWGVETTVNKMELIAAIECLGNVIDLKLHKRPVLVCCDSQYVVKGSLSEGKWMANGIDRVKNPELWRELWDLMRRFEHVSFAWVAGHRGHYWNEYADRLAEKGRVRAVESSGPRRRHATNRV